MKKYLNKFNIILISMVAVLLLTSLSVSAGKVDMKDLDEYKLKIEYKNKDIEYKYDLGSDGSVDAEIDDQVNNKKTKGKPAETFIENKLLNLDYSGSNDNIIENIFNSLGISKDYKKVKLEIEYNNKPKQEMEVKAISTSTSKKPSNTNIVGKPTSSKVLVNGKEVKFEAYNIKNNNYFKLRDIAMVLSGTDSQFNVKWDNDKKAINLLSKSKYEAIGGELEKSNITSIKPSKNTSTIYKDGEQIEMLAYNINGNNYFKLRDIGQQFNFNVSYDSKTKSVLINTGREPSPSSNKIDMSDLDEYKLKVEYEDKDIEYKYDLESDGSIDAEIDDQVNNKKTKGKPAETFIEDKLLNLDYSQDEKSIVEDIFNSLGISKDYKKVKLEIEYNNKAELEIEIKK